MFLNLDCCTFFRRSGQCDPAGCVASELSTIHLSQISLPGNLPEEVWLKIMSHLRPRDLSAMSEASPAFRLLIGDLPGNFPEKVWRKFLSYMTVVELRVMSKVSLALCMFIGELDEEGTAYGNFM